MTETPAVPAEHQRTLGDIKWVAVVLGVSMGFLLAVNGLALFYHKTNRGTPNRRRKLRAYGVTCLVVMAVITTFFDSYVTQYEANTPGSKLMVVSFDLVAALIAALVYFAQFLASRHLANALSLLCGCFGFFFKFVIFWWVLAGADKDPELKGSAVVVSFSALGWLVAGAGAFIPTLRHTYNLKDE